MSKRAKKSKSVLILECRGTDDPGSEGRFIKHMLDLMRIVNCYKRVRTKIEFVNLLGEFSSPFDIIHITTHGEYDEIGNDKRKKFTGFVAPDDTITLDDIKEANVDFTGKTVISTACFSGQKIPREKFKKLTKCEYYIAPIKDPHFHNAPLMCHIFYHKHLVLNKGVKKSFEEYDNRYRNPHIFYLI